VADTLKIIHVDIEDIRDGAESFDTGFVPKVADLKITLRNDSSSTTLHVSKLLGGFEYDETLRSLNLSFQGPDPLVTYRTSPFTPPIEDTLTPGETKIFKFTVPLTAQVISGFGSTSPGVKQIDASNVKEVVAAFSYGTAPLRRPIGKRQTILKIAKGSGTVRQNSLKTPPSNAPRN
jgi:hypothetical protein